jgi:putative serine protease PepD
VHSAVGDSGSPYYDGRPGSGSPAPTWDYGQPAQPPLDSLGRPQQPPRAGPGWAAVIGIAAVVAVVAGLLGGLLGTRITDSSQRDGGSVSLGSTPSGSLSRPADSVAGIADRVLPTVVSIEVRSGSTGGTGSGFVISSDGYLLTNNHVVAAGGDNATITVTFNDGSKARANVVGRTVTYDLAVIKVNRKGLPVAELGNSATVVVGDAAIAVGSPLGLSGTVTSGIISAVDRPVTAGEGTGSDVSYIAALQTDAAINPGNSGGPLVDSGGRVIGVNSAIATLGAAAGGQTGSIGLGFSIPINQARRVAEQLIHDGKASYPIIGATLDAGYTGRGVRIGTQGPNGLPGVTPGGPADAAGIRPGDVITGFDGHQVTGPDELIVAIRAGLPGDTVAVTFERDGQEQTVRVTLGEATD